MRIVDSISASQHRPLLFSSTEIDGELMIKGRITSKKRKALFDSEFSKSDPMRIRT